MACLELKVPVGNPERSRIDPAYTGMWAAEDDGDFALLLVEPWDKHTWLLTWAAVICTDKPCIEGDIPAAFAANEFSIEDTWVNKAWVTKLGGEQFMTWEEKLLGDENSAQRPTAWWVFHSSIEGDELVLRFINPHFESLNEVETTRAAERILRKNARNPALYDIEGVTAEEETMRWQRLPVESYGDVRSILEDNGFGPD